MIAILGLVFQGLTLLAIGTGAWQLLFHSRQMHRDLESLYVERYWKFMDDRSDGWVLRGKPNDHDRLLMYRYFQLCEDEIDLRSLGRVTDATWAFWARAIALQLNSEPYQAVLAGTETGLFSKTKALIAGRSEDPLSRNWLWRKFRGL